MVVNFTHKFKLFDFPRVRGDKFIARPVEIKFINILMKKSYKNKYLNFFHKLQQFYKQYLRFVCLKKCKNGNFLEMSKTKKFFCFSEFFYRLMDRMKLRLELRVFKIRRFQQSIPYIITPWRSFRLGLNLLVKNSKNRFYLFNFNKKKKMFQIYKLLIEMLQTFHGVSSTSREIIDFTENVLDNFVNYRSTRLFDLKNYRRNFIMPVKNYFYKDFCIYENDDFIEKPFESKKKEIPSFGPFKHENFRRLMLFYLRILDMADLKFLDLKCFRNLTFFVYKIKMKTNRILELIKKDFLNKTKSIEQLVKSVTKTFEKKNLTKKKIFKKKKLTKKIQKKKKIFNINFKRNNSIFEKVFLKDIFKIFVFVKKFSFSFTNLKELKNIQKNILNIFLKSIKIFELGGNKLKLSKILFYNFDKDNLFKFINIFEELHPAFIQNFIMKFLNENLVDFYLDFFQEFKVQRNIYNFFEIENKMMILFSTYSDFFEVYKNFLLLYRLELIDLYVIYKRLFFFKRDFFFPSWVFSISKKYFFFFENFDFNFSFLDVILKCRSMKKLMMSREFKDLDNFFIFLKKKLDFFFRSFLKNYVKLFKKYKITLDMYKNFLKKNGINLKENYLNLNKKFFFLKKKNFFILKKNRNLRKKILKDNYKKRIFIFLKKKFLKERNLKEKDLKKKSLIKKFLNYFLRNFFLYSKNKFLNKRFKNFYEILNKNFCFKNNISNLKKKKDILKMSKNTFLFENIFSNKKKTQDFLIKKNKRIFLKEIKSLFNSFRVYNRKRRECKRYFLKRIKRKNILKVKFRNVFFKQRRKQRSMRIKLIREKRKFLKKRYLKAKRDFLDFKKDFLKKKKNVFFKKSLSFNFLKKELSKKREHFLVKRSLFFSTLSFNNKYFNNFEGISKVSKEILFYKINRKLKSKKVPLKVNNILIFLMRNKVRIKKI